MLIPRRLTGTRARGAARMALVAVVALCVIGGLASFAGQLPAALEALSGADPGLLALAAGAELLSYIFIATTFGRLTGPGKRVSGWLAARTAIVAYGLGNILPGSPAPGITLATMDLRRRGMATRQRNLAMAWTAWFLVCGFLGIAGAAAVLGAARGRIPEENEAIVLGLASFVLAMLVVTALLAAHPRPLEWAAMFVGRSRWGGAIADDDVRMTGQHWHSDAMQALGGFWNRQAVATAAAASWLADAVCLAVALRAVGVMVDFDVLLLGYAAAIVVSAIPFLPGGAGAVEAALPAVLRHYGVPLDAAIAGTLAWRALALLLPAATGAIVLLAPRALRWSMARARRPAAGALTAD